MVSYISVHITPEKYSGRHTDQSHEPFTADQPSRAPQLKVSPEEKNQKYSFYFTILFRQISKEKKEKNVSQSTYPTQAEANK